MAEKQESKIVLEREYNVPLRKEWLKAPRYRRSKKAVTALREFLVKHMKSLDKDPRNVKIGTILNEYVWRHGIKNPPHHVKIVAKRDDKGIVTAELYEIKAEEKPKTEKPAKKAEKEAKEQIEKPAETKPVKKTEKTAKNPEKKEE